MARPRFRHVWVLLLASCGSNPPSSPTVAPSALPSASPTPAGFRLQALDGVTGAPLSATLPSSVAAGEGVELSVPGYLTRRTLAPSDGRLFLWPTTVDEAYVRAIVYESWSFAGTQRLFRWPRRGLGISAVVPAFARAEIESTGAVTLSDAATPDIDVVVDPGDPDVQGFLGFTRCNTVGFAISHCRVVLRSDAVLLSAVITHELGHCLGLGHSARRIDVMSPAQSVNTRFTSDERVLITMMYDRRRPGNAPPDDDQSLASSDRNFVLAIRD
jgi:Matrixin